MPNYIIQHKCVLQEFLLYRFIKPVWELKKNSLLHDNPIFFETMTPHLIMQCRTQK